MDEKGQPITILDPAFKEWDAPDQLTMSPDAVVDRFLTFGRTFGEDLPENETFVSTLKAAYRNIRENGALGPSASFEVLKRTGRKSGLPNFTHR